MRARQKSIFISILKSRTQSGQAVAILNVLIGVFVVAILIAMGYELSRFFLARSQLKTCVEAAALAGEKVLTGSGLSTEEKRARAEATALGMFRRNTILGVPTTDTAAVGDLSQLAPPVGSAQVCFDYLDPVTHQPGAAKGNVLRVTGAYRFALFSGFFMGLGANSYKITVATTTTLPAFDVVLALALAGSMDDQTNVSFVLRRWSYSSPRGSTEYKLATIGSQGDRATGTIQKVLGAPPMGSMVNALPPQNLEAADSPMNKQPLYFSEIGEKFATVGLRGDLNSGKPPGNAPLALGGLGRSAGRTSHEQEDRDGEKTDDEAGEQADEQLNEQIDERRISFKGPASMFTDLVVNLDGKRSFSGLRPFGYRFDTLATLVEASRSNLESRAMANGALVRLESQAVPSKTKSGNETAYETIALQRLEPLRTIERALTRCLRKLLGHADCHFGLVTFSDRAAQSPADSVESFAVSDLYHQGGHTTSPLPLVKLKVAPEIDNYAAIISWLNPPETFSMAPPPRLVPIAGSNVGDALKRSIDQLSGPGNRSGAGRAIILVTDTVANCDLKGRHAQTLKDTGPSCRDARREAQRAYDLGIPIYVVAVNQSGEELGEAEDNLYNDRNGDPAEGGIAAISGHNAKYKRVDWRSPPSTLKELNDAFESIVKSLETTEIGPGIMTERGYD